MSKNLLIILASILAASLIVTGCVSKTQPKSEPANTNGSQVKVNETQTIGNDNKKKITIVTSFYPMYIHTINVAKDVPNVTIVNMTKSQTGCLHDYQFTTDDLKTLESAQIFVVNGAGMEVFMNKIVKQLPNLKVVEASKGIELIKEEEVNGHVWVSVSGAIAQVKNISEQLAVLDPDNAAKYRSNTDEYTKKLEALKDKMHKSLDGIKNRNIITFHEAFPYFAKEFNLKIAAVIEREPGSEPSAGELVDTIKIVKEANVKALFAEPQYPAKAAETIAKETMAKVYTLDPMVTGPADADAYINIMQSNLKTLEEALK